MGVTNIKGDFEKQMQLFKEADKTATLGDYQLAAGVWQHPNTGLWQVWTSTAGSDITWISAHRDKSQAYKTLTAYKQFCETEDIYDPDKCTAFFQTLADSGDAEPENASGADIANITKHIREMVFTIHTREERRK
jgi:hypothetical protein